MPPFRVVVAQVIVDLLVSSLHVRVHLHLQLRLDGAQTRFHERVVVAVVWTAHALTHPRPRQHPAVLAPGILAAPVGMVDQARGRLPLADRRAQRRQYQRLFHVLVQLPTDDAARVQVHQQGQVSEATACQRDERDVTHPDLVDARGGRGLQQQVRAVAKGVPALGGPRAKRPRLDRLQTELFQQPSHPTGATGLIPSGQLRGDPPGPVAPLVLPEDLLHQRTQPGVLLFTEADTALNLGIVAGATDAEGLTHQGRGEAFLHQLRYHGIDLLQVAWLKMAKAFFRMSRSRSVRRSCSSSWRTRASKVAAGWPSWPRASAFQRYSREVCGMPRFSATEGAEWPSSSICTASFLSSSG